MKIPLRLSIAALAGILCGTAAGQTSTIEKTPLPPGPLVGRLPEFSKWTITVIDKGGEAAKASNAAPGVTPTSAKPEAASASKAVVTITKTLPILLINTTGKMEDSTVWCVGSFQVRQDAEYKKPALFSAASHVAAYVDYSKTDFPELQWVSEKNYVGVQKTKDHAYLVFRDNVPNRAPDIVKQARAIATELKIPLDEASFVDAREAYIDAETKIPVFWRKSTEYHIYKLLDAPTSMLVLPADIRSMVDYEQARLKDLARRPPAG